jgi:hypothetical protein
MGSLEQHKKRHQHGIMVVSMAFAALCFLTLLLPSTSDISELPGQVAAQNPSPPRTTRLMPAGKGGELTAPSGRAILTIPPGALAADTEVSITQLPPEAGPAVGPVYDLQPDGLRLAQSATFTVRYKPLDVPKGYRPEDVTIMQVLPGPEPQGQSGLGAAAAAAARPPYQNLQTNVDLAAGTATAQLAHLSRYSARAYATFDISEWNGELTGSFDFGQARAEHSGAADARSAYDLLGGLEAIVQVPPGQEGQGWAWVCLWQVFKIVRRQMSREIARVGYRDIEVPITHKGTVAPGTNIYDVHYNVWFASDDFSQTGISAGTFIAGGHGPGEGAFPESVDAGAVPAQVALVLPGVYWQSFSQRPKAPKPTVWSPSPYRAQQGSVVFHDIPLYRDRFYAIGVALFASIKGRPGRGTRPAEGGAMSFLAGDFVIHPVRIRQPGPAGGSPPWPGQSP